MTTLKPRAMLLTAALAFSSSAVLAQDQKLTPITADEVAADQITAEFATAKRAFSKAGRTARTSDLVMPTLAGKDSGAGDSGSSPSLFPADLSKRIADSPVVSSATLHNVFINRAPSAWGDPVGFLNDLNHSELIHVTDQYVGADFDGRYPVGTSFFVNVTPRAGFTPTNKNVILRSQVLGVLHAAALIGGTGYNHIYNVFIPPGTDVCMIGTIVCFSPDNPPSFVFCAVHSSVTFGDIGHVLFTIVPEVGVPGCASQQPSPNGLVADSVDNNLAFELIAAITDPDGSAFRVRDANALLFFEIGDVCTPPGNANGEFLVPTFRLNGHPYAIQLEYSNRGHECVSRVGEDD